MPSLFDPRSFLLLAWLLVPVSAAQHTLEGPSLIGLRGARIVTGTGEDLESGSILIREGMIRAVGAELDFPAGTQVLEVEDHVVYPAFLDGACTLGFAGPPPDRDVRELETTTSALSVSPLTFRSGIHPERSAAPLTALDEKAGAAHRKEGFGAVHVVPSDGLIAGWTAVLALNGEPRSMSLLRHGPFVAARLQNRGEGYPGTLIGGMAHLRQSFLDARWYRDVHAWHEGANGAARRPPLDDGLEAMGPILAGEGRLLFSVDREEDIRRVLRLAREFSLRVAILGGGEGHAMIDELRAAGVPVLWTLDFGDEPDPRDEESKKKKEEDEQPLPMPALARAERQEEWLERVRGLERLREGGIRVGVATLGSENAAAAMKNLRRAIEEGLSADEALACLTIETARILGVDRSLGTIEPGKIANLAIWDKCFEEEKARVERILVDGVLFETKEPPPAEPRRRFREEDHR